MKTKNIIVIVISFLFCVVGVNAQAFYTDQNGLKHDVLHGNANWYGGPAIGYALNGEFLAGGEFGRRFSKNIRVGIQGLYGEEHPTISGKIYYDFVNAKSEFYQNTGLDFSVFGSIGARTQARGLVKFVDSESHEIHLKRIKCNMDIAYGGGAAVSWNFANHWQARASIEYSYLPSEKKFLDTKNELMTDLAQKDQNYINSMNFVSGQVILMGSITFHW